MSIDGDYSLYYKYLLQFKNNKKSIDRRRSEGSDQEKIHFETKQDLQFEKNIKSFCEKKKKKKGKRFEVFYFFFKKYIFCVLVG